MQPNVLIVEDVNDDRVMHRTSFETTVHVCIVGGTRESEGSVV